MVWRLACWQQALAVRKNNFYLMRYFKLIIGSIIVFFLLMTGIGLLMPSSVTVTRFTSIDAPYDSVKKFTNNIANWRYWLNGADSSYYKKISGNKILLGTYSISVIKNDPKYIITLWQGQNTPEQISTMQLYNQNNSILVNWDFKQDLNWLPWNRLGGMLHDNLYGPSMEASLHKLKQVVEAHQ